MIPGSSAEVALPDCSSWEARLFSGVGKLLPFFARGALGTLRPRRGGALSMFERQAQGY